MDFKRLFEMGEDEVRAEIKQLLEKLKEDPAGRAVEKAKRKGRFDLAVSEALRQQNPEMPEEYSETVRELIALLIVNEWMIDRVIAET